MESILLYADDTAIIATGENWSTAEENMNKVLLVIHKWLTVNKLSLNVEKTVCMTYGNYTDSIPTRINVKIQDKNMARVENYKYLGIFFDCNLKWDKHIEYLINKTKYLVYVFYIIDKSMPTETLRIIYYAFFHSIVNYDILAWGGAYNNNRNLVQNLQTKFF